MQGTAPFAYVANNRSHDVSVIDTAGNTVVATVPVDGAPIRIAVTPDGKRAYIAIRTQNTQAQSRCSTLPTTWWCTRKR